MENPGLFSHHPVKRSETGCHPIVWALDAFSKDFETHAKTASAIRAHSPESSIHPVYVLSEAMFSGRGYSSFLRAALKPRAHQNLLAVLDHELLEPMRREGHVQMPRVLVESSADASLCTGKLLRYAKRIGAHLVAIGTHGRSRLSRWFAGSFAETLTRESSLPLLITGPKQQRDLHRPHALIVPTDFCHADRAAFGQILAIAREKNLSVHVVHRSVQPFDEWISTGLHTIGGGWVSFETMMSRFENGADSADEWLEMARRCDVEMRIENFRESSTEAILDYAKRLEGASPLIALLNSSRGSGLRDLVRSSPYPLYVAGHA